jgi:hypothetical protein
MDEPAVIHATRAELGTKLFWALHIDPVARQYGMDPPEQIANGWPDDPDTHMLKHPDGRLLLIIRTDLDPGQ